MAFLVIKSGDTEVRYPVEAALDGLTLNDLYQIKLATGLSYNTIARGLQELAPLDAEAILDRADLMAALRAFVWCARRAAGEKLTVDEANAFGWDDFRFEEAEVVEAGTDPTREAPGVVKPSPIRRTATGTSKRKSAVA